MRPNEVIEKCVNLRKFWSIRDKKFKDWYSILRLTDELEDKNKESYVSNDPRTFYNLSKHLLVPPIIPHKFPIDNLTPNEILATSKLEGQIEQEWGRLERGYRRSGKQSWMGQLVGYILSFGWYSVQVSADSTGLYADLWHPAQTYQSYSPDPEIGLVEVAHIYEMSGKAAAKKAKNQNWNYKGRGDMKVTLYDYWFIDDDGDVSHTIVLGNEFMVKPYKDTRFNKIPVITGPVGGLPDEGAVDRKWQEHFGESLMAVNEDVYKNADRLASFLQQAVRDSTEPKWLELSQGGEILQPENFFAGGIFRGQPGDTVGSLMPPPIPIELIQRIFAYDQDKQKASFSPLMFGNIQFQVAAYTLSQMAQAAQQVLRPYHEAVQNILAEIDNTWLDSIKEGVKPRGIELPPNLPDIEMTVDYPISIPGDLMNRITAAKMISPNLTLSTETAMELFFPAEIKDVISEQAKTRKDRAVNSEIGILVNQIRAFRVLAQQARERRDEETAKLYETAVDAMMNQIGGGEQPQQPPQQPNTPMIPGAQ